jgi:signal peptidase I
MYELFIGALGIIFLVLFLFINRQGIAKKVLGNALMRDTKKKRRKIYIERFRGYKQKRSSNNIVFQLLPWIGILALIFILGNQYIYFGTVLSGSMQPIFKKGDLVLMQTVDKEPKTGDIIMFYIMGNKDPITHRIIRITSSGGIMTKGDNNPDEDSWILTKDNIIGKAVTFGKGPVALKGLGAILVPEAGDFTIMRKLTIGSQITMLFQQFRILQPMIILFGTIFYLFTLIETRMENERRFKRNNKNKNEKN